jgi:hypothetical protein
LEQWRQRWGGDTQLEQYARQHEQQHWLPLRPREDLLFFAGIPAGFYNNPNGSVRNTIQRLIPSPVLRGSYRIICGRKGKYQSLLFVR